MATRYGVESGPSKWDLMLALFDAGHHRVVTFEVTTTNQPRALLLKMECSIDQVGKEDGSGESWLINGYSKLASCKFKGWFRTDSRKGWLEIG